MGSGDDKNKVYKKQLEAMYWDIVLKRMKNISEEQRKIFQVVMLTGMSISDLRELKWHHIDLESGTIVLDDGRTFPMADMVKELLLGMPREEGLVFDSEDWYLDLLEEALRRLKQNF